MEGVPKLYMLRTSLKTSPERTDFSRKVKWVTDLSLAVCFAVRFVIVDDSSSSKFESTLTRTRTAMPMKPENSKLFVLQHAIHPKILLAALY
jgi:hypothetical protein